MMIRAIRVVAKDVFGEAFLFSWSRFVREASCWAVDLLLQLQTPFTPHEWEKLFDNIKLFNHFSDVPVTTLDYSWIVDSHFRMFKSFWLSLIKNSNCLLVCLKRSESEFNQVN